MFMWSLHLFIPITTSWLRDEEKMKRRRRRRPTEIRVTEMRISHNLRVDFTSYFSPSPLLLPLIHWLLGETNQASTAKGDGRPGPESQAAAHTMSELSTLLPFIVAHCHWISSSLMLVQLGHNQRRTNEPTNERTPLLIVLHAGQPFTARRDDMLIVSGGPPFNVLGDFQEALLSQIILI